jgi:hypothetical protein
MKKLNNAKIITQHHEKNNEATWKQQHNNMRRTTKQHEKSNEVVQEKIAMQ